VSVQGGRIHDGETTTSRKGARDVTDDGLCTTTIEQDICDENAHILLGAVCSEERGVSG